MDVEDVEAQVQRAVSETRSALGAMASKGKLAYPLMGILPLIDRSTISVTAADGESAFELDEEASEIRFRAPVLMRVYTEAYALAADELATDVDMIADDERQRVAENAVNLFVLHELEHIHQNFPHFGHVAVVKAGLPDLGLPLLDVAADTVAAWANANIEAQRLGLEDEQDVLRLFANMLVLSYVIGALVFDATSKPEKTQRALGLLAAAALIQAKVDGLLDDEFIFKEWTPLSPLLVLNLAAVDGFNVLVIDKVPGLLLTVYTSASQQSVRELWLSVGKRPVGRTLDLTFVALRAAGAIKDAAANEEPLTFGTSSLKVAGERQG